MAKPTNTRSKDIIWLIGHPRELITSARLPSGHDVMKNFVYYHCLQKQTLFNSSKSVCDQLIPFWIKSRLPIRQNHKIAKKIQDLYGEQVVLMKHRSRSNEKDLFNQKQYSEKLDNLFDISHANAEQLINNEEDRQFLKLQ